MRFVVTSAAALIAATLSGATMVEAQPTELSQPTLTPTSTDTSGLPSNAVICRLLYHNGTLVKTQACHTASEWQAIRYNTRREIEDTQIRSYTSLPH